MAVIEFQPSVAYRVTDSFSIAAGFMLQYASLEMKQALDRPSAALPENDTRMKLEGETWTPGFTIGMTWKPLERTTFGIGYRSQMRHKADCKVKLREGYSELYNPILGDRAEMAITMPQSVNFGVVQELNDRWKVMADLSWTDWSVMDELKVKFKTGKTTSETMKWHDNWRVAVGTEYKATEKWTLRCGAAFDERPVTNHDTKTFKLPDSNRYWLSTGASYQYSKALRFDVAITHIFFQPSTICQTTSDGRYVKGKVVGYTNLVSLGARYDF